MSLEFEDVVKNFDRFCDLLKKTGNRSENIMKMVDFLGQSLILAPASSQLRFHNAFPGGLVDHSLRVYDNAVKLKNTFEHYSDLTDESLIIGCLFHDLGKAGDGTHELYLPQDSDWHKERGMMYKMNYDIQKMPNAERGLWLLQKFNVELSLDEWIAIRCNDGPGVDENKYYQMSEPKLAVLVHMSDRLACEQEKQTD